MEVHVCGHTQGSSYVERLLARVPEKTSAWHQQEDESVICTQDKLQQGPNLVMTITHDRLSNIETQSARQAPGWVQKTDVQSV